MSKLRDLSERLRKNSQRRFVKASSPKTCKKIPQLGKLSNRLESHFESGHQAAKMQDLHRETHPMIIMF